MVADDASDVGGSHVYNVRVIAIGTELLRTGKCGLEESHIADTRSTSVEGEKTVVEREGITRVDPERFTHLARPFRLLRESVQSVALAADDVLALFHFLFEGGVVGRGRLGTVWARDQENAVPLTGGQAPGRCLAV